jgi:hypothetical protein
MRSKTIYVIIFILVSLCTILFTEQADAHISAQIPTVDMATVTSTPEGVYITVKLDQQQVNVRSGPGTFYPKVGVLLVGQKVPAKGKSVGGEWILVEYPGIPGGLAWVYAPLVDKSIGELPVVEPPPTPTPLFTQTINPTLAAQFVVTSIPTRLPTFTQPAPLVIPTFQEQSGSSISRIPMGLFILVIAAVGIFISLFSIAQGR